jgi:hypothetical protein
MGERGRRGGGGRGPGNVASTSYVLSYRSVPDPAAFERANSMKVLCSYVLRA